VTRSAEEEAVQKTERMAEGGRVIDESADAGGAKLDALNNLGWETRSGHGMRGERKEEVL
jgi:hypothetical protein